MNAHTAIVAARPVVGAGQFILPPIPERVSPDLRAAIDAYRIVYIDDFTGDAWQEAAERVRGIAPIGLADIAAQLIVSIHYRDPSVVHGLLAVDAPDGPADRLAVEMELDALDRLLGLLVPAEPVEEVWRSARAAYDAAWAAHDGCASHAMNGDEPGYAAAEREEDVLAEASLRAEAALLETAAPDLAAVRIKIEVYRRGYGLGPAVDAPLRHIDADLERMIVGGVL